MRGINKKIISLFLAFTIVLTTFGLSSNTSYAASIKLNKTNITLLRKQTSQLKVKNTKKRLLGIQVINQWLLFLKQVK